MKNKSNPHDGKLANSPKIQKKEKKSYHGEEALKLFNGQHKKKLIANRQKAKGEKPYNNTKQMQAELKDDIIMEILSRLPIRYLVQFKCVSKLWNELISDPYFTKKHVDHAKNDPHSQKFIFYRYNLTDYTASIYTCPLSSSKLVDKVQKLDCPCSISTIQIYCSFNGLVIIGAGNRAHARDSHKGFMFMLWNPSTKESILLPEPKESILLPEPLYSRPRSYCMGLGYDSTIRDYKILIIRRDIHRGKEPGQILALKSGSWRIIDKHPHGIDSWLRDSSLALLNDAFHFICSAGEYTTSGNFSLVSFSISNEVYTDMSLPKKLLSVEGNILVGVSVLDGMLCAHCTYYQYGIRPFELWVLKDYDVNESWNPLFSIRQWDTIVAVPKYRFADGEVLSLFKCDYIETGHIIWKHSFRTFTGPFGIRDALRDEIKFIREGQDGIAFTESLISPKSLI